MRSLWSAWPTLKRRIGRPGRKLLLLDFDGTLVAIAPTPDSIRFEARTEELLSQVASLPGYSVAIVSGRSLKDLKSRFRLKNVTYVGNHGLEMNGTGVRVPARARQALQMRLSIGSLAEKLKCDFLFMPGVIVEDKGYTVSVHYRNVQQSDMPAFTQTMAFFREKTRGAPLAWRRGKKVWELFPKVRWHKGHAAVELLKKRPGALPIVIGDDRTDEDMFRAMSRFGVTIRVGQSRDTHADYYVKSQPEVHRFLEKLCHEKSG